MKKRMIILLALGLFLSCTAVEHEPEPKMVFSRLRVGEAVYVCGCPMMCCNSISMRPGRCVCNVPLRSGVITLIHNGKIHVNVSGREKVLLMPNP